MESDSNPCRVLYRVRILRMIGLGMFLGTFGLELSPRRGATGAAREEVISILLYFWVCCFAKDRTAMYIAKQPGAR